jgi:hypothetical protein
VLLLRAKSDVLIEFEKWLNLWQNGTGQSVRTGIFDKPKELKAGRMKEMHGERGIWIISSVSWTHLRQMESRNALQALRGMALGYAPGLRPSPSRFWGEAVTAIISCICETVHQQHPTTGRHHLSMKPDVGYRHTFGCVVKVRCLGRCWTTGQQWVTCWGTSTRVGIGSGYR